MDIKYCEDKWMHYLEEWICSFYKNYTDPDGIQYKENGYEYNVIGFYEAYKNVLQNRNKKFEVQFQNKKTPGLIICNKDTKKSFNLKSDLFGFSVPSPKKNHPYDIYLILKAKAGQMNDAIAKVEKWIESTRIIGGSFFWPMEYNNGHYNLNPKYNLERGGTIYKRNGSYIEDRVDLTLFELKEIYDSGILKCCETNDDLINRLEGNVLYTRCFSDTMKNWLSQFDSFDEYVDFFALSPFVDDKTKMPYDIFSKSGDVLRPELVRKRVLFEKNMTIDQYEIIFDNVVNMTKERNKLLYTSK